MNSSTTRSRASITSVMISGCDAPTISTVKFQSVIFDFDGNCVGDEDEVLRAWHFHPIDSDNRYKMPIVAYWLTKRQKPFGTR